MKRLIACAMLSFMLFSGCGTSNDTTNDTTTNPNVENGTTDTNNDMMDKMEETGDNITNNLSRLGNDNSYNKDYTNGNGVRGRYYY